MSYVKQGKDKHMIVSFGKKTRVYKELITIMKYFWVNVEKFPYPEL